MTRGASPAGVDPANQIAVSRQIREMFGRVAPRYDFLNRLLSLRIDQYWRSALVRNARPYLERPAARVLDLCCGTGDLVVALDRERKRLCGDAAIPVTGADFSRPMLAEAGRKLVRKSRPMRLIEADALEVPARDASFDLITIAWGFRNLADYDAGLREFARLTAPGGCLAILEFSQPTVPLLAPLFGFYFRHVLPRIGNAISGSGGAYSYLQNSVEKFLTPGQLSAAAQKAGFRRVEVWPLSGGISVLHMCYK
jgi:demethylmenaquinone methyltransferase/2-methoxy-6-polyprenyl-1,4-benzoquinol methylase